MRKLWGSWIFCATFVSSKEKGCFAISDRINCLSHDLSCALHGFVMIYHVETSRLSVKPSRHALWSVRTFVFRQQGWHYSSWQGRLQDWRRALRLVWRRAKDPVKRLCCCRCGFGLRAHRGLDEKFDALLPFGKLLDPFEFLSFFITYLWNQLFGS